MANVVKLPVICCVLSCVIGGLSGHVVGVLADSPETRSSPEVDSNNSEVAKLRQQVADMSGRIAALEKTTHALTVEADEGNPPEGDGAGVTEQCWKWSEVTIFSRPGGLVCKDRK